MPYSSFQKTLAALTARLDLQQAKLKADPIPILTETRRQMLELKMVLHDVENALCDTNWVYDSAAKIGENPNFYKADTERVRRAREILTRYL